MFPFVARMAVVLLLNHALTHVAQHPRIAPLAQSRKGRIALAMLGWGLRRHPRTRAAGHAVRVAARRLG